MKTLEELNARKKEVTARLTAIASGAGELLTDEVEQEFDVLDKENGQLDKQIVMTQKALEAQAATEKAEAYKVPLKPRITEPAPIADTRMAKLPASVRKWGK